MWVGGRGRCLETALAKAKGQRLAQDHANERQSQGLEPKFEPLAT